jgi:hypothetical protein
MVASSMSVGGPGASRALSRETVDQMTQLLELDEVQREVALDLFKDVTSTRQELSDALRAEVERARESASGDDMSAMFSRIKEATAAFQSASATLEETYMQDLRALLTPAQEEAWPKAERLRRRTQHQPGLTRSLARVDLDALVRERFESAYGDPEVADVLDRWSVQVDTMLVERARKAEDIGGGPGFQGGVFIIDGEDPYAPLRAIDGRVASATEQAVRTLGGVLEHDGVEQAWVRSAFARVFRQTDAERRLETALALESLTSDQTEQLKAAGEQHAREVGPARDRWVAAEKEREEDDTMPPGVMVIIEGQDPTPSEAARNAVEELDQRLEARLASILTAEQLAELPEHAEPAEAMQFGPAGEGRATIRIGG